MTVDTAPLRRALAAEIGTSNPTLAPQWGAAVAAVPRDLFLDTALYRPAGSRWEPVRRGEVGEQEWLRLVYADRTLVTQVDGVDAADATGPISGIPTSSATLPSLVVRTLQVAELQGGDKVLEVGTGTGYSTAILCHRLGEKQVVSIEYDTAVAASAAAHLKSAGYSPTLVVGDGLQGHQEQADYDAVIATCAVRSIPRSWLWQLADGGSITTTISGWMLASGLIRLTLDDTGAAHGRFTADPISYMLARPHERPPHPVLLRHDGNTSHARVAPALLQEWAGCFVAQLAAPSAELMTSGDGVVLRDVATGSQAWTETDGKGSTVHQHGPLRLWDQVEAALETWQSAGAPALAEFGMTVSDTALDQTVWLGSPDGPRWHLPI
ncbi:methyltransferase [Streptomyces venezuelae]|uniref:Protein-L-isoaspartate O-methyltransferase n=1 Tax=Streptomyces venezuelae TaxID=54571 RepID=A0A5P2C8P0_STRVZ|nr:ATP-grasp peptide maturase system methyltransferase [Streptomyces venezuelae]QES38610.1 methyltransferase [Streptomyces venezuelae]